VINMKLETNIKKYYLFSFLNYFLMSLPFLYAYYLVDLGFTYTQIGVYGFMLSFTIFLFEVPSGYLADSLGRKLTLFLGAVFHFISIALLLIFTNFLSILLVPIFGGLGQTMISGADSALFYESLKSVKKEKKFKKYDGKAKTFQEAGVILSTILGSIFIIYGIKLLFFIEAIIGIFLIIVSLSFIEPKKKEDIELSIKDIKGAIDHSIKNNKLLGIFVYSFFVMGFSNVIFFLYQPYFLETGIPIRLYGFIFAFFSLFTALFSYYAHKIDSRLGIKNTLLLMPILVSLSYLFGSIFFVWWGIIFFAFRELVRGLVFPVVGDYLNKNAKSKYRATILSINAIFSRLGYGLLVLVLARGAEIISLKTTMLIFGIILSFMTFLFWFFLNNGKK